MKALIASIALLAALAVPARANDSGDYAGGVRIDVTYVLNQQHVVVTTSDGSQAATVSTPDPSGDPYDVLSSGTVSAGGASYRFRDGRAQTNDGSGWVRLPRTKGSRRTGELEGSNIDFRYAPPPHFNGGPGEDIQSLPGGGGRPPFVL